MKRVGTRAGFSVGQSIVTKIITKGCGGEGDEEMEFPAGTGGTIHSIEDYGAPEGWTFTVIIGGEITNAFDETDGPITDMMEPAIP